MPSTLPNVIKLDEDGLRLLKLLVSLLPTVKPNDPRTFITYKEVHERLKLQQHGTTYGESLKVQGLSSLADWTASTGKPGITGLIYDKEKLSPGPGYYKLFGKKPDNHDWWFAEIQRSIDFPWAKHIPRDNVDEDADDGWDQEELRAAVVAYLEMQNKERTGVPFIKSRYYEDLATKFGRTSKAFEYRMQNISYVLSIMGRAWLSGLKPAKNVGPNVAAKIEALISEIEGKPTAPVVAFEIAVRKGLQGKDLPTPTGSLKPQSSTTTVTQYQRDPAVKAWVLSEAKGICECCRNPAPFTATDGIPFLEVHHIRKLAEQGSDTVTNAVAICPNCHRELHYGERAKDVVEKLYQQVPRLRKE